ncbi:MAG: hypothetical protein E7411_06735 [Ruminococcaceae bacterium]|nr:hypothetical protein [Oscillospiraceae bacterium]
MKKIEKIGYVFNIILTILYIPISLFSFLLGMLSETVMDTTSQMLIRLIHISSCVAMIVPVLCFIGILFSIRCRKKGYIIWSFVLQFAPLVIFCLNFILIYIIDIALTKL